MRRSFLIVPILLGILAVQTGVLAQTPAGTPVAVENPTTLVLTERADTITDVDVGEPGPSTGDLTIWGPNPLLDESGTDTGATSQGACVVLYGGGPCVLTETLAFPDGSTIQLQGIEAGGSGESTRTIVGGSGQFLGIVGTVHVQPTEDLSLWVKTIEYWIR